MPEFMLLVELFMGELWLLRRRSRSRSVFFCCSSNTCQELREETSVGGGEGWVMRMTVV